MQEMRWNLKTVNYIDFSTGGDSGRLWDRGGRRNIGETLELAHSKYTWDEWEGMNPSQRADAVFEFLQEML